MTDIQYRPITQEEIPVAHTLMVDVFGEEALAEAFGPQWSGLTTAELASGFNPGGRAPIHMLGAFKAEEMLGLGGLLYPHLYVDTYCITSVCVKKEQRGQGIGTAIIKACIDLAKKLFARPNGTVMVIAEEKNVPYYQKLGFEGSSKIHPITAGQQFLLTQEVQK